MIVADAANPADPLRSGGVAETAAEGIARVGRVGDNPALAQDARSLPD